ncbi:MAG: TIGR01212 family radical SAM protein [Lachnospiraceae bacterium]|nr:TIGR01212 family radical SAM protein [Lachnospiraceae bacterium]
MMAEKKRVLLAGDHFKARFGCKVYKIALNGGFTCPNRDGKIGNAGCIFCSKGGSGEFAEDPGLSITQQIEHGKQRVAGKLKEGKYIAYFQAYTGTYAPYDYLKEIYLEAIQHPDIVALSIGTRPDCLPDETIELLSKLNTIKPVWIELGLQTIHERTAEYIRRGYSLSVYDDAVRRLEKNGIETIVHVIIGLAGESKEDISETVRYVCKSGVSGIKLQLLHILKGTDLEKEYIEGKVRVLSEDEYIDILKECIKNIPEEVIIHRLTGDGDKKLLVAPKWSADKKHVFNRIQKEVLCR